MLRHFVSMNLVLFLLFAVPASLIMLPINALNPYEEDVPPAPPPMPPFPPPFLPFPSSPPGFISPPSLHPPTSWPPPSSPAPFKALPFSGVQSLSLSHIPPRSSRYWASAVFMALLTCIYLVQLRHEWLRYVRLRREWLSAVQPQHYAILLTVPTPSRLATPGAVEAYLEKLYPGQVHTVVPTAPSAASPRVDRTDSLGDLREALRPALPSTPPQAIVSPEALEADFPNSLLPAAASASCAHTCSRACCGLGLEAADEAARLFQGKEGSGARFIVLLRSRVARLACVSAPELFGDAAGGAEGASARAAPHPMEVCWSNLAASQRPSAANAKLALSFVLTVTIFLLWTPVVTAVQTLVSIDALAELLDRLHIEGLKQSVENMTAAERATVQGWLASLILALLQVAVLYSGVLARLSKLQGHASWTKVAVSTQEKMFFFNFVLVLLASCIVGSLWSTLGSVLRDGICYPVAVLGKQIPSQATFFLSYLLQELLLFVPALDVLQALPLLLFTLQSYCCRCCSSRVEMSTAAQQLVYPYLYARVLMVVSITLLFCCIAPLVVLIALPWLFAISLIWSHNLRFILAPPPRASFDSGGAHWPSAVGSQTLALVVAQLVLGAIHALNASWLTSAFLLAFLPPATWLRAKLLRRHFAPRAEELPIEICAEIDGFSAEPSSCSSAPALGSLEELHRFLDLAATDYMSGALAARASSAASRAQISSAGSPSPARDDEFNM